MKQILLAAGLVLPLTAQAETALYIAAPSVSTSAQEKWDETAEPLLASASCQLHRSGTFGGSQGPLAWPEASTFSLYKCRETVLEELSSAGVIDALSTFRRSPVLAEGQWVEFDAPAPTAAAEYVIKVSHFNGLNDEQRKEDLADLGTTVSKLEGVWHTEAVMLPSKTIGTLRPDELTFLFYENSEVAESFRNNHPEILELIGGFNTAHLNSFIYLGASVQSN